MMLTEVTVVPTAALPVFQFRDHLRLGTGFADGGLEDGLLETYLRASIAAVEAWTGKALIERDYMLELDAWGSADSQALPVAPARALVSLVLIDAGGAEDDIGLERVRLSRDTHRPEMRAVGACLPGIPPQGAARLRFRAGFGPVWTNVPPDLAQAVLLLGAYYYEYRHELRIGAEKMPYGITRLIASWRALRLRGGGAG